jgi:hypothetical protein
MRLRLALSLTAVVVLACGGSDTPPESGTATDTAGSATDQDAGQTVSTETIARCAGFTVEDAAEILAVPVSGLEDRSRDETETIRICSYVSTSDPSTLVAFNLSPRESVAEAISEMAYNREMMGVAQTSIEGAMGEKGGEPAYEEIDGVGDEAFWSPLHGAMQMRVGDVFVQVTMPNDLEKQKAIGRKVAEGLTR